MTTGWSSCSLTYGEFEKKRNTHTKRAGGWAASLEAKMSTPLPPQLPASARVADFQSNSALEIENISSASIDDSHAQDVIVSSK